MNKARYVIGIDPGKKTGVAVYDRVERCFIEVATMPTYKALFFVQALDRDCIVYVEDARKRKWYGGRSSAKQQGAGAIKVQCSIWEEMLTMEKIKHQMIHPIKGATKWGSEMFVRATGWQGRTSGHSRDAALIALSKV